MLFETLLDNLWKAKVMPTRKRHIEHDHLVPCLLQLESQVAPDEPCPASDYDLRNAFQSSWSVFKRLSATR